MTTTIPTERLATAQLAFAQICRGIQSVDAVEEELTLLPLTLSGRLARALKYYLAVRPIFMTLTVFPLIPASWRHAILAFLQALDAVVPSADTPVTTPELPPLPDEPSSTKEFKAGKDQAKPQSKVKEKALTFRPIRKVARDARTGTFITLAEAHRRPSSTVVETVKYPPRPAVRKS